MRKMPCCLAGRSAAVCLVACISANVNVHAYAFTGDVTNITQGSRHASIQAAINAAVDGDEIEVGPGTYVENINYSGKTIALRSTGGPEVTTIMAAADGTVVTIHQAGAGTVLQGFTVTGGTGSIDGGLSYGGGLLMLATDATIEDCIVESNCANFGGGALVIDGSPTFMSCSFISNHYETDGVDPGVEVGGGGMAISMSSPMILTCVFDSNGGIAQCSGGAQNTVIDSGHGGGLWSIASTPTVIDTVFSGNFSSTAGGAGCVADLSSLGPVSAGSFDGCTFTGNEGGFGAGLGSLLVAPEVSNSSFCKNIPDDEIMGQFTDNGKNTFCFVCDGDVNGDGLVGVEDILAVLGNYGTSKLPEDLNGNGSVDVLDLLWVIGEWGPCL